MTRSMSMLLAVAWLLAGACFAPPASAQVYKCVGSDGKTTFSGVPCSGTDKQTSAPGGPRSAASYREELKALCDGVPRNNSTEASRACMVLIEPCVRTGGRAECAPLCLVETEDLRETFPASKLVLGRASGACLAFTNRVRGSNWVEHMKREQAPDGAVLIPFQCLDASDRANRDDNVASCRKGSLGQCALMMNAGYTADTSLGVVATSYCTDLAERRRRGYTGR